jgi:predicted nucleic acid-binding protein
VRVTLDTNIYVSALHFGGKPMELLQMGLEGELDIATS